jgi:hypothetical protein
VEEADEDIQAEGGGDVTQEQRKYLKEFSRCELCGSPKKLELHHIIPTAFGGPDVMENWIAICSGCHGKLTPRGILIKHGMHKDNPYGKPVSDFCNTLLKDLEYAKETGDYFCADDDWMWDVFTSVFMNKDKPIYSYYVGDNT